MRVLIIDDQQECLDDIFSALMPTGYQLTLSTNAIEAFELAKKEHFDVILTDVYMPLLSGIEFLEQIKRFKPNQRVILITAYGDLRTAMNSINLKAYGFFGKPIAFNELINTLRDIEREITGSQIHIDNEELMRKHHELGIAYQALLGGVKKNEPGADRNV